MRAVIQRVSKASVSIEGSVVGEIHHGLVLLLGVDKGDTPEHAEKLLHKILHYRVFGDDDGKMNLNVQEVEGGLLYCFPVYFERRYPQGLTSELYQCCSTTGGGATL